NPSPAALRLEHAGGAWHVRKCRGGNVPARAFAGPAFAGTAFVGAASAASFCSLPCEGRGRSDALASHWLAHRGATASCAGGPDGLERGAFGHRREPWTPPRSLPRRSQGEGAKQELAAEAAPTKVAAIAGLH